MDTTPQITKLQLTRLADEALFGDANYAIPRSQWESAGRPMEMAVILIPSKSDGLESVIAKIAESLNPVVTPEEPEDPEEQPVPDVVEEPTE